MHLFHRDADFWLRARGERAGDDTELDGDRRVQAGVGVAERDEAWYLRVKAAVLAAMLAVLWLLPFSEHRTTR